MSDRIEIGASAAQALIAEQFPQWADLPVRPVATSGWDNRTFRLGEDMSVRLPSAARYSAQVEKEHRWLPRLAPLLPLPIPVPLAMGAPTDAYRWNWSVYRWIEGEPATTARVADLSAFAGALAQFLTALERIDARDGPPAGEHNFFRGGDLAVYDAETRQAIEALADEIDPKAARAVWDTALASTWQGAPVWVHGDVVVGNLLVRDGRLGAVIDFGSCGVGDPACDLTIAWTFFDKEIRQTFRDAMPLDDATWARGRGWTLWKALITLEGSRATDPAMAAWSRRALQAVFADHAPVG